MVPRASFLRQYLPKYRSGQIRNLIGYSIKDGSLIIPESNCLAFGEKLVIFGSLSRENEIKD